MWYADASAGNLGRLDDEYRTKAATTDSCPSEAQVSTVCVPWFFSSRICYYLRQSRTCWCLANCCLNGWFRCVAGLGWTLPVERSDSCYYSTILPPSWRESPSVSLTRPPLRPSPALGNIMCVWQTNRSAGPMDSLNTDSSFSKASFPLDTCPLSSACRLLACRG